MDSGTAVDRKIESPFDRPIGVDENCLSARRIVRLLKGGVIGEDLDHLLSCPTCLENIGKVANLKLEAEPSFVVNALRRAAGVQQEDIPASTTRAKPSPLPVVLGLYSRILSISNPKSKELTLTCAVIPCFEPALLRSINRESLQLDGAIIASDGSVDQIDITNDGTTDYLKISFENARLAPRVRDGVAHNQRVIDTIRLRGRLHGRERREFVGEASLEIMR